MEKKYGDGSEHDGKHRIGNSRENSILSFWWWVDIWIMELNA